MSSVASATSCSKSVLTKHPSTLSSLLLLLVLAGTFGCGESSNEVSVHGRVTYRGEPIENGSLNFFPPSGRPVSAALSEDGQYELELPPGDYTVTVNVGMQTPPGWKEGDPTPKPKFVLPPEYTTRARSQLSVTVEKGSKEPINFEL